MPTGYTCILDDRDVSVREYILRCARAFGACVEQLDESLDSPPRESIASTYHRERLEEGKRQLEDLLAMTTEQVMAKCEAEYEEELSSWRRRRAEWEVVNGRYTAMAEAVHAWTPPTAEHQELKQFALEQLKTGRPYEPSQSPPERCAPETWRSLRVGIAERGIVYHEEMYAKEVERVAERNAWLRDLQKSVEAL